ncbi:MAG: hypothetical protein V9H26_16110 [Verrucomicrobiota bacterium]
MCMSMKAGRPLWPIISTNHTGAAENGKSVKQSDATGTAGASAALPCPDAGGNRVPIPSGEGQAPMQDARRHQVRAHLRATATHGSMAGDLLKRWQRLDT